MFDSKYSLVQLDNYPLTKLVHKSVVHSQRAPYSNADWEVRRGESGRGVGAEWVCR